MAKEGLTWVRSELEAIVTSLKGDKRAKMLTAKIGPATEFDRDACEGYPPPDPLIELARAVNGVELRWRWSRQKGNERSGAIVLFPLESLEQPDSQGIVESGEAWNFIESCGDARVLFHQEGGRTAINVFDLDGYVAAEDVALTEVLRAQLDRLGIEGWSLSLKGEPTDEDLEALSACDEAAREVRTALGLPIPSSL